MAIDRGDVIECAVVDRGYHGRNDSRRGPDDHDSEGADVIATRVGEICPGKRPGAVAPVRFTRR